MIQEMVPLGDSALLVNFESQISIKIHQQVLSLVSEIEHRQLVGITFLQPAYCSLAIGFDPAKLSFLELKSTVRKISQKLISHSKSDGRLIHLPVCYQPPYALDLDEISQRTGLTKEEIVDRHTGISYQVFMLGFLPGFPYLGILPKPLQVPRKETPRLQIPERSVGIAGLQTGIYPSSSPGGWNILGVTPVPVFNGSNKNPFLLRVGDRVKFQAIGMDEYKSAVRLIAEGAFDWDTLYG